MPGPLRMTDPIVIHLSGDAGAVRDGLRRAMAAPALCRLAADQRATVEIVLAEILNNIAEHAYAAGDGPVRLWLRQCGGLLSCRVEDEGLPMPGGRLPRPPVPPPESLAEGGYGWHLIRTLALGLAYERDAGVNRLSFRIPAGQSRR